MVAMPAAAQEQLKQEAKAIVKQFGGQLKPQLKQAMVQGGPQHAVEVCAEQAPEIAKQLSEKTDWQVRRVSLNYRNPDAEPKPWESKVLTDFENRLLNGEKDKLVYSETVNGEYRFMKAQLVEPICLTCHGRKVDGLLHDKIQLYYPKDKAMGYQLGQIRGAFSLSRKLAL